MAPYCRARVHGTSFPDGNRTISAFPQQLACVYLIDTGTLVTLWYYRLCSRSRKLRTQILTHFLKASEKTLVAPYFSFPSLPSISTGISAPVPQCTSVSSCHKSQLHNQPCSGSLADTRGQRLELVAQGGVATRPWRGLRGHNGTECCRALSLTLHQTPSPAYRIVLGSQLFERDKK